MGWVRATVLEEVMIAYFLPGLGIVLLGLLQIDMATDRLFLKTIVESGPALVVIGFVALALSVIAGGILDSVRHAFGRVFQIDRVIKWLVTKARYTDMDAIRILDRLGFQGAHDMPRHEFYQFLRSQWYTWAEFYGSTAIVATLWAFSFPGISAFYFHMVWGDGELWVFRVVAAVIIITLILNWSSTLVAWDSAQEALAKPSNGKSASDKDTYLEHHDG